MKMLIHCLGVHCTPIPDGLGWNDVYSCPLGCMGHAQSAYGFPGLMYGFPGLMYGLLQVADSPQVQDSWHPTQLIMRDSPTI